jgi:glutathione-specific gamma-glutamylcyclotransferase
VAAAIDAASGRADTYRMTAPDRPNTPERIVITREVLRDGSLLARVRANPLPGMTVRSDAEIEASLDAALAAHDPKEDSWLFAYGSLMWNPAIRVAGRHTGLLRGWHRQFCFWIVGGRGSPEYPGLMLGLVRGGCCHGIAFRIAAAEMRDELLLVWRREMFGNTYLPRWVNVATEAGVVRAVTFIANPRHERYVSGLSEAEVAGRLAIARGALGSGADYLRETRAHLRELGLCDGRLERIGALMDPSARATRALYWARRLSTQT